MSATSSAAAAGTWAATVEAARKTSGPGRRNFLACGELRTALTAPHGRDQAWQHSFGRISLPHTQLPRTVAVTQAAPCGAGERLRYSV